MTSPTDAVTAAVGQEPVNIPAATENVTETATDSVPTPSETAIVDDVAPKVDHAIPDPPADATDGQGNADELRETVNGLVETVGTLVAAVQSLLPSDSSPTKMPWTHFGSR